MSTIPGPQCERDGGKYVHLGPVHDHLLPIEVRSMRSLQRALCSKHSTFSCVPHHDSFMPCLSPCLPAAPMKNDAGRTWPTSKHACTYADDVGNVGGMELLLGLTARLQGFWVHKPSEV